MPAETAVMPLSLRGKLDWPNWSEPQPTTVPSVRSASAKSPPAETAVMPESRTGGIGLGRYLLWPGGAANAGPGTPHISTAKTAVFARRRIRILGRMAIRLPPSARTARC